MPEYDLPKFIMMNKFTELFIPTYYSFEKTFVYQVIPILNFFFHQLLQNYAVDPVVADLLDNIDIYFVPVFNVDGYEFTWTDVRKYIYFLRCIIFTKYILLLCPTMSNACVSHMCI